MQRKYLGAICIIIFVLSLGSFAGVGFSEINSKPYVSGTTIYAGNGTPLRLQGFNAEEQDLSIEDIQWLKNNGFNSLRLEIFWHRYEPEEGVYSTRYFSMLDDVINYCGCILGSWQFILVIGSYRDKFHVQVPYFMKDSVDKSIIFFFT